MPQEYAEPSHEVDHIIAEKHAGKTELENLALACFHCNNHKGPNIAGLDPDTRALTRIFDPRHDSWKEHFTWDRVYLVGKTSVGRTTIFVLAINIRHRVVHRQALLDEGVFPFRLSH